MNRIGEVVLAVLAVTAASPGALADRRTALAGSQVIEDPDDVWVFPQLALVHSSRIGFDLGAVGAVGSPVYQGSGMLLLGFDGWAIGAGAHRGDLLAPGAFFAGPDADLAGLHGFDGLWDESWVEAPFLPEDAPTIADLLAAFDLGKAGVAGLRVTGGFGTSATTDTEGKERVDEQQYVGFTLGYSYRSDVADLDASVEFGWDGATESDDISRLGLLADGDAYFFGVNARAFFPVTRTLDIAVLAAFGLADYYQADAQAATNWKRLIVTGSIGAGPRVTLGDNAHIGAYLTFGDAHNRLKPREEDEGDDDQFTDTVTAPGLHLAGEFRIFEWLYFRAGMLAAHRLMIKTEPDGSSTESHPYDFRWHSGLGFEVGDFRFDGAFAGNFLTSGPSFLGQSGPLYVIVSASYSWGRE